jgi:hypothetical protein
VLDDARHVEGPRTSEIQLSIAAPFRAHKAGAQYVQRGLSDGPGYLRLPCLVRGEAGVRFTAKIPVCWPPGLEICVIPTVPDSKVPAGQVTTVNMADYESMGSSVGTAVPVSAAPPVVYPAVSAVSLPGVSFGSFSTCRRCSTVVASLGASLCDSCLPGASAPRVVPAAAGAVSKAASSSSVIPASFASFSGAAVAESLCLVACAPTALGGGAVRRRRVERR